MHSRLPLKLIFKVILQTPELLPFLIRGLYRKHFGTRRDYRKANGYALKPPFQISLRITNACNHKCDICGQYGIRGYMHEEKRSDLLKTLPFETYKELVDYMAVYRPLYYVTGGEAFLYKDLVPLMNYIKQKKSPLSVVTNGVKLSQYAEEIVKNGWDMILVSFDGPEQIHDMCRRTKGAYRTAVDGLLALKNWRNKLRKKKPYILTSTTLSQTNINYLVETFEIGKVIEPDVMVVYLSWFTSENIGKAQAEILQKELGEMAYTWKSYVRNFTEQEAQNFSDNLAKVLSMKWPFDFIVIPNLKADQIKEYYLHPQKLFGYSECIAPFTMIDIMPNGDVVTCRDYIDIKVGNITEDNILNIWNNEKFVKFRQLLIKNNGVLPQCSRCCGLMGF